ncbi:translation initiation factor IF-2 [Marmota monax]|uniref:translation initiation factor IF-2 n=1 Tax=Marmota monax TaxID=9995 RepID=UPI001EB0A3FA|nr:translation initiation factor IF-2 [Marmota monax]
MAAAAREGVSLPENTQETARTPTRADAVPRAPRAAFGFARTLTTAEDRLEFPGFGHGGVPKTRPPPPRRAALPFLRPAPALRAPRSLAPLPPDSARLSPLRGFLRAENSSAEPRGLPRAGLRPGRGDAGGGGSGGCGAGTVSPPKERLCWKASRLPGSDHRRKRERLGKSAAAAQGPWGQPGEEAMGALRADLAVPRRARVGCTVARGADSPAGDRAASRLPLKARDSSSS